MRTGTRAGVALTAAAVLVASSCSRATPAGFWNGYRADMIVNAKSDQGPWGGSRSIEWVSNDEATFTTDAVGKFAEEHGWTCEPPVEYSSQRMSAWVSPIDHKPNFPLFFGEPDGSNISVDNDKFPRAIEGDSFISRCDTEWVRVAPGSGDSSPAFGYIHVSKDGRRLAVYHLWGEV